MSIYLSGLDSKQESRQVEIFVSKDHPLLKLSNSLDWEELSVSVIEDLKNTTKNGFWWLGRRLSVRTHLGVYLVQKIFDKTDRQMESDLRENAAYQLFCGFGLVENWHVPDHTKIEEFRNRLSVETQKSLANAIAQRAVELGFGDPSVVDIDSTVQEANIAYPSDSSLMVKLSKKAVQVLDWLKKNTRGLVGSEVSVDIAAIQSKAKGYFFLAKNACVKKRRAIFAELHAIVKIEVYKVLNILKSEECVSRSHRMPWNIRQAYDQLNDQAKRYLLDVAHFIRTNSMKPGKILSLHAKDIACIVKGKAGKPHEFGRVFQLGRIGGNFVFTNLCTDLRMDDKKALPSLIEEHQTLFGDETLKSLATDRGYYSRQNNNATIDIEETHLGYQWAEQSDEDFYKLRGRRAGIEPIIGHVKKKGQLGRSRMKSDNNTLAAGYGAMVGFNLRQMIRHQMMT